MASIFSTQNLQTFLRRKNLRPPPPPSRPPPGPPGREEGRRSPRSGRSPPEDDSDVDLVSSAMMLLKNQSLVIGRWSFAFCRGSCRPTTIGQRLTTSSYAVAAGTSPAASVGVAGAAALRFASL